jgi:hypothetical protein
MPKFKIHLQQYVEETAVVEIESDTIEWAVAKAEQMVEEGDVDWSDGDDVIRGAAACIGSPAYSAHGVDNDETWERE